MEFSPHARNQGKKMTVSWTRAIVSVRGVGQLCDLCSTQIHLTDGFDMEVGR